MSGFRGRRLIRLSLLAALACGGGDDGPSGPQGNTVVMGASTFVPTALTIARDESVTWSNTSGILHNVTFTTAGAPANIPDHTAGNTVRTFATAGTFAYDCTNHAGMSGTVTVQ
jgi:plastocyanin